MSVRSRANPAAAPKPATALGLAPLLRSGQRQGREHEQPRPQQRVGGGLGVGQEPVERDLPGDRDVPEQRYRPSRR